MKILLISMLVFASCSAGKGQNENHPVNNDNGKNMAASEKKTDKVVFLKPETEKAISKAKKVVVYEIKEFITGAASRDNNKKYFADYEIVNSREANKGQSKEIKNLLLNRASYSDKEFISKCPFTASRGLEFISKKKVSTKIIISFQCKQIFLIEGDKETYKDLGSTEKLDKISQGIFHPATRSATGTGDLVKP